MIVTVPTSIDLPAYEQRTSLDGQTYRLGFRWNERAEFWSLSIFTDDGDPIVEGLRIVVRWPLLRRVAHPERPPGQIIALDSADSGDPGLNDLGTRVVLYYIEAESLAQLGE